MLLLFRSVKYSTSSKPSSSSALDLSLQKSHGHKLDHLYQINYVPEDERIPFIDLSILDPYHAFSKPHISTIKCIKSIIQSPTKKVKEYVQATIFDQFLDYQHACIGTVETTLNAGTIFITLFLNINMSLLEPYLLSALKVQVQIFGAPQISSTFVATIHYQMAFRAQNHALDLVVPQRTEDALMITINSTHVPSCTHIPKQISCDELIQLMPKS
ncbi:hypothetical protein CFOL_v3_27261 [Cephalotus follicularis]|uniref:MP domain-containing protein n=1 Tax=Cephalotus follicularis TaxID=3775 RepID=A0A1Q3CU91_CEPFO|nr:hypothetical protein CFOL_v3_27261 [Cephalotus follicularis]